jgi:hypothetical protein
MILKSTVLDIGRILSNDKTTAIVRSTTAGKQQRSCKRGKDEL